MATLERPLATAAMAAAGAEGARRCSAPALRPDKGKPAAAPPVPPVAKAPTGKVEPPAAKRPDAKASPQATSLRGSRPLASSSASWW